MAKHTAPFAKCEIVDIRDGGYRFFTSWELPAGVAGRLHVGTDSGYFPLKRLSKWALGLGPSESIGLSTFLSYLRSRSLWRTAARKSVSCKLAVGANPKTEQTVKLELVPPVAPYVGMLGAENVRAIGSNAPIKYVGTGKQPFIGRYFHTRIDRMYFFKYGVRGGRFVTELQYRGFDCITFAGSVFGAQSHMDAKGDKLANHLNAKAVAGIPDDSEPAVIFNYFKKAGQGTGTFLLWSGGHVVIVYKKTAHEFAPGVGYAATPVLDWLAASKRNRLKFCLRSNPQIVNK